MIYKISLMIVLCVPKPGDRVRVQTARNIWELPSQAMLAGQPALRTAWKLVGLFKINFNRPGFEANLECACQV